MTRPDILGELRDVLDEHIGFLPCSKMPSFLVLLPVHKVKCNTAFRPPSRDVHGFCEILRLDQEKVEVLFYSPFGNIDAPKSTLDEIGFANIDFCASIFLPLVFL